ncbi:kinase-like domain-containing protein [Camillea tinctor]|nr:kinase-like domain-containing protein [Camillea tinctor]
MSSLSEYAVTPTEISESGTPHAGQPLLTNSPEDHSGRHITVANQSKLPLDLQLKSALHKCAYGRNPPFLPDDKFSTVMEAESVEEYLKKSKNEDLRNYSSHIRDYVCGPSDRPNARGTARRIFAILLIMKEPSLILDIMNAGIDDNDLPLQSIDQGHDECLLARKAGNGYLIIEIFSRWAYVQRLAFWTNQWRVKLPVFLKGTRSLKDHPVHRLESKVVLPWIYHEPTYDGNSEVIRVKIHHAHHRFDEGEDRSFALKSLKAPLYEPQSSDSEFRLEVKALLKVKPRRHLEVDLLTTFEHQQRYHLLFRWADGGNLDDLWRIHYPHPTVTSRWILWLAEQCCGLAHGLDGIHNTKMTVEEVAETQFSQDSFTHIQDYAEIPPGNYQEEDDGRDYGRHGDIKPQNVLWFNKDKNSYQLGILKLSDFGLTTFHRALTTKVNPSDVRVTPTYSAPEREIDETLSRPFDIWSLGCIFLEFVTWLLCGVEGLDTFNRNRFVEQGSRNSKFLMDDFYMLVQGDERKCAEVKPSVYKWIKLLKRRKECSPFLSDFLNYIQTKMLVVDISERDNSRTVSEQLKKMFTKCKKEPNYVLRAGVEERTKDTRTGPNSLVNQKGASLITASTGATLALKSVRLSDENSGKRVDRKRDISSHADGGDIQHDNQTGVKRPRRESRYHLRPR